jgi:3'-phosphoadenosine 5'-phosphosulfate sulfotransferase (PAPS reductase)/FAD synthetase
MRFCTSEAKTSVICSALRRRFPGEPIVSATGLRREESFKRAITPVLKLNPRLTGVRAGTRGWDWAPIAHYALDDIWQAHQELGLPVHEAYQTYGSSRVSCSFCIMSSSPDLAASFRHPGNRAAWGLLSDLEIESAFSFQGNRWLSDLGLDNADTGFRDRLAAAKAKAVARHGFEVRIPRELLYVAGWPTFVPNLEQSGLIAAVRRDVCGLYGWESRYLDATSVQERYAELFTASQARAKPVSASADQQLLLMD